MSFPFNFAKNSKGRHFKVRWSKNLKLSPDTAIDSTFQKMYQQVYWCLPLPVIKLLSTGTSEPKQQVRRPVISIIVNRYMSNIQNDKHQPKYISDGILKMSTIFVLEIKGAKNEWVALRNGWLYKRDFGELSETIARLLKSIISQFFSKYWKSYNILNAKSCLKLEGS